MNLISGQLIDKEKSLKELNELYDVIVNTQKASELLPEAVISACDTLSKTLSDEKYIPLLLSLGIPENKAYGELREVRQMLSRKYLETRLNAELPKSLNSEFTPLYKEHKVTHIIKPLGILFHIVAGNVDALPVFSVIEGLLTGNINILKLPGSDNGLSVSFLKNLIDIEPVLKDYIHVFDYPSEDVESMKKMAELADAIIIWGGDSAVSSVRNLAQPDTKIIEWGHKISFAYISGENITEEALEGIAHNICDSNQLYCSSCQGIYLDTDNFDDVCRFAQKFAKILDRKSLSMPGNFDDYLAAQKSLEIYTEILESAKVEKKIFKADNCSVIAYTDSTLTPSYMFRNCWVRPLPKEQIIYKLRIYKSHLQTVALVCEDISKDMFISIFSKTGIVRITSGKNMSEAYCGMPHDGEFSLQRYVKIISCEL